jgi:hypothetical protein
LPRFVQCLAAAVEVGALGQQLFLLAAMSCSTLASWRRVSLKVRSCSRRALLR